jgi:hypothetical protein
MVGTGDWGLATHENIRPKNNSATIITVSITRTRT